VPFPDLGVITRSKYSIAPTPHRKRYPVMAFTAVCLLLKTAHDKGCQGLSVFLGVFSRRRMPAAPFDGQARK
jgi:hypothetical protein